MVWQCGKCFNDTFVTYAHIVTHILHLKNDEIYAILEVMKTQLLSSKIDMLTLVTNATL